MTHSDSQTARTCCEVSIQEEIDAASATLIGSLPDLETLSAEQRRAMIARYTAVLEGNFIYWMTGAYLAAKTDEARAIILENLHDEIRDCHPGMLRRFAQAASSTPSEADSLAVDADLMRVRLFIGNLDAVRIVVMMAFFEGFIQKFMAYLAELAAAQGSAEREYTDVHGVCDVTHTEELFRALDAEMSVGGQPAAEDLFEGVAFLRSLIQTIVQGAQSEAAKAA